MQRDFVRHIWLNIEVQQYKCPHFPFSRLNGPLIVAAIRKIFSILSKWKPGQELTLELHAYRPSDLGYYFKGFYFATDAEGDYADIYVEGSITGHSNLYWRAFVVYGTWLGIFMPRSMDFETPLLFQQGLPATVKTLTVFEDFNEEFAVILARNNGVAWHSCVARYRIADPGLGAIFASQSRKLERLSVSFLVDAKDFFDSCVKQHGTWRHLETLALTVRLFQQETPHQEINDLLLKASEIAVRMPKLRTMVLWNGARGNACAFVFQAKAGCAFITWRSTWDHEINHRVEEAWEQLASRDHSRYVLTKKEKIQGQVASHGDAIHLLDLPCQVVEPASLWQIRREGAFGIVTRVPKKLEVVAGAARVAIASIFHPLKQAQCWPLVSITGFTRRDQGPDIFQIGQAGVIPSSLPIFKYEPTNAMKGLKGEEHPSCLAHGSLDDYGGSH
ncbi:uncharacterized protein VDAG_09377 [Verticillium dahliae VdLs.17]|uniref:DUF6546 domain-containing protein n=1 Tax=Verticillium dahliae (strain VdLs.17 / ATCC MYA-4575 / FGSC 10137) TaxID=498257 RepID=G2XGU5_VERDV|nr:uncharacterized protein VDAG_09377 [Verticillium dahliae VdLs.17]EGY19043.1 hypothetical protein VDAG_09377 [Verticillium dahliae VdLs.17]